MFEITPRLLFYLVSSSISFSALLKIIIVRCLFNSPWNLMISFMPFISYSKNYRCSINFNESLLQNPPKSLPVLICIPTQSIRAQLLYSWLWSVQKHLHLYSFSVSVMCCQSQLTAWFIADPHCISCAIFLHFLSSFPEKNQTGHSWHLCLQHYGEWVWLLTVIIDKVYSQWSGIVS